MRSQVATLALIGSLAAAVPATAANFVRMNEQNQTMIALTGEIVRGDAEKLRDMLAQAGGVTALRLDSPGGNLVESIALSRLVRGQRLNTAIGPNAACASACFLIFAAGREKFADRESFIGVHGVADKGGAETADSKAATLAFARYVQELGAPPSVVYKLIATPPHEIVQLSLADLRGMGATITGRPVQAARGITPHATQAVPETIIRIY